MAKYYAVRVGKAPGVYRTWEECQKSVRGFSGAVYKSFPTVEQAQSFVYGGSDIKAKTDAVAYVDGSYDVATNTFSCGVVFLYNGKEAHFSQRFDNEEFIAMRNVAGELMGAMAAMKCCLDNGIRSITIYHDYEGIAKWCTGEWAAKKEGTRQYLEYYKKVSQSVCVEFVKVKGHSGDHYNDLADKLAREAGRTAAAARS